MIVEAMILSLPMLADVLFLALFFFAIFGIACTELFKGTLSNRCAAPDFTYAYNETGSSVLLVGPKGKPPRGSLAIHSLRCSNLNPTIYDDPPVQSVTLPSPYLPFSQNVSYIVSDYDQVCRGPMASSESWDISTGGIPVASSFSYVGGRNWGYACPWQNSLNPNDLNWPVGLVCVPWGNPDPGGTRNFDTIFSSWIMVFQHMAAQDW